jgi:hypothetical protein
MRFAAALTCLIMGLRSLSAQSIGNITARLEGERIVINYDLANSVGNSWLDVRLLSSHNSFSAPVAAATGDVGKVEPGLNKEIAWLYGRELDNFNGDLRFEIEVEVVYRLILNRSTGSIRRGKPKEITWTGGRISDKIHLHLESPAGETVWQVETDNRPRSFTAEVRRDLPVGRKYQLVISTPKDEARNSVKVKRKTARVWFFLPVVLAAPVIYLLLPDDESDLPGAPEPPTGN